ncbi:flagellin [Rhodovulum sp. ES.010]|uniref:flagellin n=1 Tax=Rhodovulum sp. ES.010 TaxID=1882821 RepID=UPI000940FB1D|nr:flagellin [Rhodovulum sp. ES.010]
MSSILTNTGAMTALQTLKSINKGMADVQNQISTGKAVDSARDNAAVWAISKVMDSDVKGFEGISDSLALGESSVAVARNASESITDLLTEMKGKIVAAQEENVDRAKLQTDIDQLTSQIESVVGAAQFNGLNLVNGSAGGSTNSIDILSSLDRSSDGTVQSNNITVDLANTNLSVNVGTDVSASVFNTGSASTAAENGGSVAITGASFDFAQADGTTGGAVALRADELTGAYADRLVAGDQIELDVGGVNVSYTINEGDGASAVLGGLRGALEGAGLSNDFAVAFDGTDLTITNNKPTTTPANQNDVDITVTGTRGQGGLSDLNTLSVTTDDASRTKALNDIEDMIQYSIDAAAEFGSAQSRIEIQSDFVSKLTDSLKAGIGTLVDANMEEASARLQALQVQQQLGTQSLSIANQAPQNLLSLFR